MNGKIIVTGMLLTAAVAGVGLWYSIEKAYYHEVTGVTEVTAYGDAFPVSDYQGIDADTSPLKMRACFKVNWDYFPTDEFKDAATPLRAPRFFKCFDAGQMTVDLQAGAASAILADENHPYGFDTYITQYPDGRAYMWRQINDCGEAQFSGNDLPEGCPSPDSVDQAAVAEAVIDNSNDIQTGVLVATAQDISIKMTPYTGAAETIDIMNPTGSMDTKQNLWLCFETEMSFGFISETYQVLEGVKLAQLPSPRTCFDPNKIESDIASGTAMAVMSEQNIHPGVDRVIAVYEDGQAYAWHQKAKSE